ncbi:ferredoxin [Pseudonocardia sp. GCM10023141]|uniref:ferredoxin n=1 Tax=Pseudonocardia sp. GCM10023141 TaxID=3252653 RepID=UPI0036129B2C
MHVETAKDRCIGAGQCVLAAPEVFDQDDEGTVDLLVPDPSAAQEAAVREAVHVCPAQVITLR